ncbi:hypothetical protein BDZ89DRAFT_1036912 [Hymenopellis radicata]|nr:hypothetical protein BDZ89DRAFT_1036912 [Hymenopellis radicata]
MYAIKAAGIIPTFLDGTKVAVGIWEFATRYEGASPYDIFCAGLNGLVRHGNSIWLGPHRQPSLGIDSENELGTVDRADLVRAFHAKGTRLGSSEDWDNFNVAVDDPKGDKFDDSTWRRRPAQIGRQVQIPFFERLFSSTTVSPDIQHALRDPQYVPQFMRRMSESRNITLLIQSTFLGQPTNTNIILVYRVYSNCDADRGSRALDHSYILPVQQHEPGGFPAAGHAHRSNRVHVLPNVPVWVLVVQEATPNPGLGVVFALLACTPLGFHVVWFEDGGGADEQLSAGSVDNATTIEPPSM